MTDFQIPTDGAAELPTGSERATSRRAAGPNETDGSEEFQTRRYIEAVATAGNVRRLREFLRERGPADAGRRHLRPDGPGKTFLHPRSSKPLRPGWARSEN